MKQLMTALLLLISMMSFGQVTVTGFSPAGGPIGTLLHVTGTNLNNPTSVIIDGVPAIIVSSSSTSLACLVMPYTGAGHITVTASAGTGASSGTFLVTPTLFPTTQQGSKLRGSSTVPSWLVDTSFQGWSVAMSADGNTALIGGPADSANVGATWVYTRTGSTWTQQGQKLVGTGEVGTGARQGSAVALSADGNTAVIGGLDDNNDVGAAWIFTRSGTTWTQQGSKLVGTGYAGFTPQQGSSVAISADGNTVLVGAFGDNGYMGATWVYTRSGTTWAQQGAKLVGTGAVFSSGYVFQGKSVSLSADGNTAMVGGYFDNGQGAAWVFTRSGTTWTQQGAKLVGTGATGSAYQGISVSLSADGNTAMVGGYGDNGYAGAAWVYTRVGTTWTQQGSKLTATGAIGNPGVGSAVSLSADGNTAVITGAFDNGGIGAVWKFTRSGNTWTQRGSKIVGTGAIGASDQGGAVALSADGNTAIAGGYIDSSYFGAAWIFTDTVALSYAGLDQTTCLGTIVQTAATGTGVWSAAAGNPASVFFTDPTAPVTYVGTFYSAGLYKLIWTSAGQHDTMTVTVNNSTVWPGVMVTASQPSFCAGSVDTFSVTTQNINSITSYQWFSNWWITGSPASNSPTYIVGLDSVSVIVTCTASCASQPILLSNTYTAYTRPLPTTPVLSVAGTCLGSDSLELRGVAGNQLVQWYQTGTLVHTTLFPTLVIAGGNGSGSAANQLANPGSICKDASGNIYVADIDNYRIQKFPAGCTSATNGTTVAGGNGQGSAANQFGNYAQSICIDPSGNVYIADPFNNRIQKFPAGSTSATNGITVAGGNGQGSAANQLYFPAYVGLDASGNLYVCDANNARIMKFPAGSTSATNGTVVGGGNGLGSANNQLNGPNGFAVDGSGNVYMSDDSNGVTRIREFPAGSTSATYSTELIVESGYGPICTDVSGNLYINNGSTVKKYPAGNITAGSGVLIADGYGVGSGSKIYMDVSGDLYLGDGANNEIWERQPGATFDSVYTPTAAGQYTASVLGSNGCTSGISNTILISTCSIAGPDQTVPCAILPGGSVTMAATGTGVWSAQIGNPGTATITTASNPTSTIVNFSSQGVYRFLWTSGSITDTALVTVTGKPDAGPDQTVSCVALPGGSATMAATGVGTWTAQAGNPGTAVITNTNNPATIITTFSAAGIYHFIWTNFNGCTDTATVTITTVLTASVTVVGPDTVCGGSGPFTFAANPINGGSSPSYQWYQHGIPVGSNSAIYIVPSFSNNDSIWVVMTSSAPCASPSSATSNHQVIITVPALTPSVSILGPSLICIGTGPFTFAATPTNGGPSPSYQWFQNGALVGSNSSVYVSSSLSNHDSVCVMMTSSAACPGPTSVNSNVIVVSASTCLSDSVWPGDADHNGIADNNDLLPIGTGYGLNGFPRASTSIVWQADYCQDWGLQFLSGVNAKHADCNGDGVIDANDTTAILLNFGLTHAKTGGYGSPWRAGIPGITIRYSKDTVAAGDTLITSLILGDSVTSVSNIYGLAFTFHYDPLVVDTTSTAFGFINSFLGNTTNKISIHKDFSSTGMVKAAVTGINHTNRSGYGEIARFHSIITADNINGKDLSYYSNVSYVTDITAVDDLGHPVTLNAGTDSDQVAYTPTGVHETAASAHISIYPNPAAAQVRVSTDAMMSSIVITDMLGQSVLTQPIANKQSETIDISQLASGVYTIHVSTLRGTGNVKLIVSR